MNTRILNLISVAVILVLTTQTVQAMNSCEAYWGVGKRPGVIESIIDRTRAVRDNLMTRNLPDEKAPIEFLRALRGKENPILKLQLDGPPEAAGLTREAVMMMGNYRPVLDRFVKETWDGVERLIAVFKPSGTPRVIDGRRIIETTNPTSFNTTDSAGKVHEWALVRAVHEYKSKSDVETGKISQDGYVSDVLLVERVNGKTVIHGIILPSNLAKEFKFEDPRISVIYDSVQKRYRYFLSGTDYSPHIKDDPNSYVMNRFVELAIDPSTGKPKTVELDPETTKPDFMDISPKPRVVMGKVLNIDAKNGTIYQNWLGQIIVRARMRPDFKHPFMKILSGMTGIKPWDYAEQVFVFRDWAHFEGYSKNGWADAMIDLYGVRGQKEFATVTDDPPIHTELILRDSDLQEHMRSKDKDTEIVEGHKGFGPGTRPAYVIRRGNKLFIADAPHAPETFAGEIPREMHDSFPLKEGEMKSWMITFDHEIRYVKQKVGPFTWTRRHYTASFKIFDSSGYKMIDYVPDAIQPKTRWERGFLSAILDLLHVYPMGWTTAIKNGIGYIRIFAGASDAHSTIYGLDLVKFIASRTGQMKPIKTGQTPEPAPH